MRLSLLSNCNNTYADLFELLAEVFDTKKNVKKEKSIKHVPVISDEILNFRRQIQLAFDSVMSKRDETAEEIIKLQYKGETMRSIISDITSDIKKTYSESGDFIPEDKVFKKEVNGMVPKLLFGKET